MRIACGVAVAPIAIPVWFRIVLGFYVRKPVAVSCSGLAHAAVLRRDWSFNLIAGGHESRERFRHAKDQLVDLDSLGWGSRCF
jgi:hypothetical protein